MAVAARKRYWNGSTAFPTPHGCRWARAGPAAREASRLIFSATCPDATTVGRPEADTPPPCRRFAGRRGRRFAYEASWISNVYATTHISARYCLHQGWPPHCATYYLLTF